MKHISVTFEEAEAFINEKEAAGFVAVRVENTHATYVHFTKNGQVVTDYEVIFFNEMKEAFVGTRPE